MDNNYVYLIVALMPLSALMLVLQVNPYHALVIRGILGAMSALTYALLGAADVSLTEALVGTMLAITLYAVAVRSSLVMRVGVLQATMDANQQLEDASGTASQSSLAQLITNLKAIAKKHYLRLELSPYADSQSLSQGLLAADIHAICTPVDALRSLSHSSHLVLPSQQDYHTVTRIARLYEIFQSELSSDLSSMAYINTQEIEAHTVVANVTDHQVVTSSTEK